MTPQPDSGEKQWDIKRVLAQDIINELFKAGRTGSIQVLLMQCSLSAKQLDPESWHKFIQNAYGSSNKS